MLIAILLQLFTDTTVPSSESKCVTVLYGGYAYRAMKVERWRLTGSVTLTMPGGWEATGTPPPTTPAQAQQYEGERAAYQACVDRSGTRLVEANRARHVWERCAADPGCTNQQVSDALGRLEWQCVPRPLSVCGPEPPLSPSVEGCSPPQVVDLTPRRRRAGRQIQLKSYETIFNDTGCDCGGASKCIDK